MKISEKVKAKADQIAAEIQAGLDPGPKAQEVLDKSKAAIVNGGQSDQWKVYMQLFSDPADLAKFDGFIKRENKKWAQLCEKFLPVVRDNLIWRFSDEPTDNIPQQGWKLHVAATLLSANAVFGKVAPWLQRRGSLFKAPRSLSELQKINCGLYYG